MPFNDAIEKLIEKTIGVLETSENVIKDEFTRFNTIYVGNQKEDRVTFELQLTLPEISKNNGISTLAS